MKINIFACSQKQINLCSNIQPADAQTSLTGLEEREPLSSNQFIGIFE